jgi:DNA invertase Pin-like site-specific DNA recombinase
MSIQHKIKEEKMMKVVIYARHSGDIENDTSISEQIIACTKEAQEAGIEVFAVYSDEADIGSTKRREGLMSLIADARVGDFDIVLTQGFDRLSRAQNNLTQICQRLARSHVAVCSLFDTGDLCYQVALEKLNTAKAALSNLYGMAAQWETNLETLKASEGGQAMEKEIIHIQTGFQRVVRNDTGRIPCIDHANQGHDEAKTKPQTKEAQLELGL